MRHRAFLFLFVLGGAVLGQEAAPDRPALERWRRMSEEEKTRIRERMERLRSLKPEERARLRENFERWKGLSPDRRREIQRSLQQLTPEERRDCAEVASAFFHFGQRRGILNGFPRALFFAWLKQRKPGEIERLRAMEVSPRVNAFIRLYWEFKERVIRRTASHLRKHGCIPAEDLQELREAPVSEFWVRWQEMGRRCRNRGGGPVPPRMPPGEPKK